MAQGLIWLGAGVIVGLVIVAVIVWPQRAAIRRIWREPGSASASNPPIRWPHFAVAIFGLIPAMFLAAIATDPVVRVLAVALAAIGLLHLVLLLALRRRSKERAVADLRQ